MKIKSLMTEDWEEGMIGIEKYCWELGRGRRSSVDHCWGAALETPSVFPTTLQLLSARRPYLSLGLLVLRFMKS